MGEWMDSKNAINIGDYVYYKDSGQIVCDNDTKLPLKVIKLVFYFEKDSVLYENGEWDFIEGLERASPLLLELI
jgi:hypothetical protein